MISTILCTHNPRPDYLRRTLEGLRRQDIKKDDWELVVVDNACDPPFAKLADLGWHPRARVVCERTLGLTEARLRGLRESRGDLIVFVDDDNVLADNYLKVAWNIASLLQPGSSSGVHSELWAVNATYASF